MMEAKKISFGFSKVSKKPDLITNTSKTEKQLELIDCLEDQSIKIKDVIEEVNEPLVIPIKGSTKNLLDRIKEAKKNRIKNQIDDEELVPDSALSVDELAARELIREAKNRDAIKNETKIYTLPLKEDKSILSGEEEPSLEDYESVPIFDYGMAMLRGMGWKEGMPIGKTHSKAVKPVIPELRPKGLGLGATKMVNKQIKTTDKDGKELQLVKGGFGKIVDSKHKGQYCEIQGVDVETSRCIIKLALTNEILSLHEYSLVPITKEEYAVGSKVLNNVKYEEYKEKSYTTDHGRSISREKGKSNDRRRNRSHDKYRKEQNSNRISNSEIESDSEDSIYGHNGKSFKPEKEKMHKSKKKSKKHKYKYSSNSEDDRRDNKKKHRTRYKGDRRDKK